MADFYLDIKLNHTLQWIALITAPDGKARPITWPNDKFITTDEATQAAIELFKMGANGDDRLIDRNDPTVVYVDWR